MEMKQFANVFSELVVDGLKETTKIIQKLSGTELKQTDTTVKQEETEENPYITKIKQADTIIKQEETVVKPSVTKQKQVATTIQQDKTAIKPSVTTLKEVETDMRRQETVILMDTKKEQETTKLLQKSIDKKQMIVRIRQHEQNRVNFIMKNDLIEDRLELEATGRKQEATSQEQKTTGQEQKKIGQLFQDKEDTCTNWEADLDARQEGLASWQEELEGVRRSSAGKSVTIALLVLVLVLVLIILFLVLLYTFTR